MSHTVLAYDLGRIATQVHVRNRYNFRTRHHSLRDLQRVAGRGGGLERVRNLVARTLWASNLAHVLGIDVEELPIGRFDH